MNKELNRAKWSYYLVGFAYGICALTSFGLSAAFLILFATNGTLDFYSYDFSQAVYAVIMILLTASATTFLFYLYQETNFNVWYKVTAIFVIAGLFSGGSEIGTQMQRHDEILMNRSKDSAEYQEAVKGIGQAVNASVSNGASPALLKAIDNKAKATAEIKACQRHNSQARRDKCIRYESKQYHRASAQIKAIQDSEAAAKTSNSQIAKNMASLAKDLSHNEKYSLGIVKFIMSKGFGLMAATLLIAFIMIGAFEMAFHGLGGIFRRKKDAYFKLLEKPKTKAVKQTEKPTEKKRDDSTHTTLDAAALTEAYRRNTATAQPVTAHTQQATQPTPQLEKGHTQHSDSSPSKGYEGNKIGFTSQKNSVSAQSKPHTQSDNVESLYAEFKDSVLNGDMGPKDKQGVIDRTAKNCPMRSCTDWLNTQLAHSGIKHPDKKRRALINKWVNRMGDDGLLIPNPDYTPSNRKPKWLRR